MTGQIVLSVAGRDKGKIFLSVDTVSENYLLLADGRTRKLVKPKKKKLKHIKVMSNTTYAIPDSDKKLQELLKAYSQS